MSSMQVHRIKSCSFIAQRLLQGNALGVQTPNLCFYELQLLACKWKVSSPWMVQGCCGQGLQAPSLTL